MSVVSSRCHTYIPIYEELFPPTNHYSWPFRSVVRSVVVHPEVVGSTPGSVTHMSAGVDEGERTYSKAKED